MGPADRIWRHLLQHPGIPAEERDPGVVMGERGDPEEQIAHKSMTKSLRMRGIPPMPEDLGRPAAASRNGLKSLPLPGPLSYNIAHAEKNLNNNRGRHEPQGPSECPLDLPVLPFFKIS